jgi:D-beta-D-heptose 7-phosphate kinase/D-beta-D-heptose 1-phosphate adenosyltransferase
VKAPLQRRLARVLERMAGLRLLVVGDVVLDEFVLGDVERVSPEAPVPVVRVREQAVALGGAANVARAAAGLGASPRVFGVVGDDEAGACVAELLRAHDLDPSQLLAVADRPTTRKTRVVARSQQLVRLDRESGEPLARQTARELRARVRAAAEGAAVAVLADYGKGVLGRALVGGLLRDLAAAGVPAMVDPKDSLAGYRGAALLKPNLREAAALSGMAIRDDGDLATAAARLQRRIGGGDVVITRGARGMAVFRAGRGGVDVPTRRREVFDVQGAGDTAMAALALSLRAGADPFEAAVLANAAAGVVVGKFGTATADRDEVRALLPEVVAAVKEPA